MSLSLRMAGVPYGYITGLVREPGADEKYVSHLYEGTFDEPGLPMCKRGWNRGDGYSIWRNNVGRGVCKVCVRRAKAWKPGVECPIEEIDYEELNAEPRGGGNEPGE